MLRIVIKTKSNVSVVKLICHLETDLFSALVPKVIRVLSL